MTKTIRFEELRDKMKVRMVLPWWSPTFYLATVVKHWDDSGFHIEINRRIQDQEFHITVANQQDLDEKYFIISDKNYKKNNEQAYEYAKEHSAHLLKLSGKKDWHEYLFG